VVTFKENLNASLYRDADKSLARPWKETSYSDQDSQHYTKTHGEVYISHENTSMVVWIYDGVNTKK